jgi:AcrR family transcriptional regulator
MARARRSKADDSATRTALLDAAEELMVDEGYAAATTRRVAAKAGVNNGLVHYYFGTMDELFVELFRRGVDSGVRFQVEVLESPQPLWGMWDLIHDYSNNLLVMEFIALANHRKAIRAELTAYWKRIRTLQLETLSSVLEGYGVDPDEWPASSVIILMVGVSRFLLMEEAFDVDLGHAETVELIERHIRALEGERQRVGADAAAPDAG